MLYLFRMPNPVTISRNAPCPCGSGRKYKRCCLGKPLPPRPPQPLAAPAALISSPDVRGRWWMPLVLLALGVWAYAASFTVPFLFDDGPNIVENMRIRHLWPLWRVFWGAERPSVEFSLALNYALGRLDVWSYHAVNLAIHLAAGCTLFGLVRRTLLMPRVALSLRPRASWFALSVASLWVVHPLQTQSVTYIIQRAETLMGLCALCTLYVVCRGATAPAARWWYLAAIIACGIGMLSKPVMAVVPLVVLLYDRTFLAGSFRQALTVRGALYLGLAATWGLCTVLAPSGSPTDEPTAGFAMEAINPWAYARTQFGVVAHYLRLTLWPSSLVFDYGWPIAQSAAEVLWPGLLIVGLLMATAWAWRCLPTVGFLGVCTWLLLAPSSSIFPIKDLAFEYRMYLPLAPLLTLFVLAGDRCLSRLQVHGGARTALALRIIGLIVLSFGLMSRRRLAVYQNEVALWTDTLRKRPKNPRAHNNLRLAFAKAQRFDEAILYYTKALQLQPRYVRAYNNLANALAQQNKYEEAIATYTKALQLNPRFEEGHNNFGLALVQVGWLDEAMVHYRQALRLRPDYSSAHNNLGLALAAQGQLSDAVAQFQEALRLNPDFAEPHNNLGLVWLEQGDVSAAVTSFRQAITMKPDFANAYYNLADALSRQGMRALASTYYAQAFRLNPRLGQEHDRLGTEVSPDEAVETYTDALSTAPDDPGLHHRLAVTFARQGNQVGAITEYLKAVRLAPEDAEIHYNLGNAFAQTRAMPEALSQFSEALRLKPDFPEAHNSFGLALAERGDLEVAIAQYTEALRLKPDYAKVHLNLSVVLAKRHEWEEATTHVSEALRIDPSYAKAQYVLGLIHAEQGHLDEATAHFSEAIRLKPDYVEARHQLAFVRLRQNRPVGAVDQSTESSLE